MSKIISVVDKEHFLKLELENGKSVVVRYHPDCCNTATITSPESFESFIGSHFESFDFVSKDETDDMEEENCFDDFLETLKYNLVLSDRVIPVIIKNCHNGYYSLYVSVEME